MGDGHRGGTQWDKHQVLHASDKPRESTPKAKKDHAAHTAYVHFK